VAARPLISARGAAGYSDLPPRPHLRLCLLDVQPQPGSDGSGGCRRQPVTSWCLRSQELVMTIAGSQRTADDDFDQGADRWS